MTPTLRPMSLGEILDRTFQIYRSRFLLFVGVAAIPALAMRLIHIVDGKWIHAHGLVHPAKSGIYVWNLIVALGFYHISSFLGLLAQPAHIKLTSSYVFEERCSILASLKFAAARGPTYLWAASLKWLTFLICPELAMAGIIAGGAFLLDEAGQMDGRGNWTIGLLVAVAVVVGCVLFLWLTACSGFTIQGACMEGLTGYGAMRRSWALTRGSRWRIAFSWLLLFAIFWILSWGLQVLVWWLANLLGAGAHLAGAVRAVYPPAIYTLLTVLAALTGPIFPIALTLFYYDQRIRLEGYDIERMMDAAGLNAAAIPPPSEAPMAHAAAEEGGA